MKLNRKSPVIRLAYKDFWPFTFINDHPRVPDRVNLCPLFWRCIGVALFTIPVACIFMPIIYIFGFLGLITGHINAQMNRLDDWFWARHYRRMDEIMAEVLLPKQPSLFKQFIALTREVIKARKDQFCPTITIQ